MNAPWTIARIRALIADQVEESLTLDYKSGAALAKSDSAKRELTKDVSAFANSAGGIIVFGVQEGTSEADRHLPKSFSPIKRGDFSREWLEQVIANIRPRIEGLVIHPVPVDDSEVDVIYVVEIPQSETAHQATDFRYYKRWNFESIPMHDYEVRDVMSRRKHPKLTVSARIIGGTWFRPIPTTSKHPENVLILSILLENCGSVTVKHAVCFIDLPQAFSFQASNMTDETPEIEGVKYSRFLCDNAVRDRVKGGLITEFAPPRITPVLPGLSLELLRFQIRPSTRWHLSALCSSDVKMRWRAHGDEASPQEGVIAFDQVPRVDCRTERVNGDIWDKCFGRSG